MKKRKMMATGSIAVALFLSSYATGSSANYITSRPDPYAESYNITLPEEDKEYIGVSAVDFREDLGIDPTFTDSLIQQGFTPSQIQKIFATASLKTEYDKMPLLD